MIAIEAVKPAVQGLGAAVLFGAYCEVLFTVGAHTTADTEGRTGWYIQMYPLLCPRLACGRTCLAALPHSPVVKERKQSQ